MIIHIKGYELILTCCQSPEQYDVYKDGKQVAYFRLRHGEFTAEYPDCDGETVYHSTIGTTKSDGKFRTEEERIKELSLAIKTVHARAIRDA